MPRRFQFSLRALLVLMLAVACFFGGIRVERERRRREDAAALAASNAERAAVLARMRQWVAPIPAGRRDDGPLAEAARREKINQELADQQKKVDLLMARFKVLPAGETDE